MQQERLCCYNKIGISGKMGSGKSTVARLMAARLNSATGHEWQIRAFADTLKHFVCEIYGVPACLGYTDIGKQSVPPVLERKVAPEMLPVQITPIDLAYVNKCLEDQACFAHTLGRLFQIVGETFRVIDPDYWVRAFEASLRSDEYLIIEDVRFPNEVEWVRNNFGLVCRVDGGSQSERTDGRSVGHISETALDGFADWDFVVDNTRRGPDLSELHAELAEKLNKYF